MNKVEVINRIVEIGIVPVVRAQSNQDALRAAAAITAGGVPVIEITMTVPGAIQAIAEVANEYGNEVLVGAGTVLDAETARACILAGAQFVVSPSLHPDVITMCHRYSRVAIPGALTPTEVISAWQAGADFVKIFPCGDVGGAKYLKSLKAPFPDVQMIPTGGVSLATAAQFIEAGAAAIGVGSDLVDAKALRSGNLNAITESARKFAAIVHEARLGMEKK